MKSKVKKIAQAAAETTLVQEAFAANIADEQAAAEAAAEKDALKNKKTKYTGYISALKWQKFTAINDCRDMSNNSTMNMIIDEYITKYEYLLK